MLLLIRYAEKLLSDYEFTVTVFDDNFKICFDKDELYKIIYSYEDDIYSAFGWVSIEHDKISGIIKHYNFELFEKIQIKYKVSQYVFVKDNKVVINRSTHPQSSFFKERLVTVLLPAIEYFIDELDFKITLNTAFYKYPDQFEDVEDKFPLFKYDFQYANSYCESIFKLIEEKIEYFSHIILSYNLTHKQDSANAEKNKSAILPFEQKLAHLKTVYELNHNKEKPITPNINIDTSGLVKGINHIIEKIDDSTAKSEKKKAPDTQAFGGLIKEYFEVAQKVFGVPKLEDLASNKYSVPTWSKMFDNKVFLYVLSQRIEKKLNNKRINAITKEIYIKLKLDIDSKIEIATSTDKSKSGQTSRRNKGFNENNYQSEDDDDSNSY
ncbi:MAG: hypothetical protein NTY74_13145 [Ignavibacteriae bacterium]|nr:hypothetical protein [Ignavibacteriota bacterium]